MKHYQACPVCGSQEISLVFPVADHSITGEIFEVWRCASCTLQFTQDIPGIAEIAPYYASKDYVSHSDTKSGMINNLYHKVRSITLKAKRKMLHKLTGLKHGSVLDIGCGTGAFLHEMQTAGWEVTGIEADATARLKAHENYRIIPKNSGELFNLQGPFDAITLWHVLEHVHLLHEYIAECKRLLKPGGVVLVAVPNHLSYDAKQYKTDWAAWDVPRHLYHFSPKSMETLMNKHGFKVEEVRPMWYDSFYVSMLSEKYRSGGNLLKALMNGLISNLKAYGNRKKCSSLIYVIRVNSV